MYNCLFQNIHSPCIKVHITKTKRILGFLKGEKCFDQQCSTLHTMFPFATIHCTRAHVLFMACIPHNSTSSHSTYRKSQCSHFWQHLIVQLYFKTLYIFSCAINVLQELRYRLEPSMNIPKSQGFSASRRAQLKMSIHDL